MIGLIQTETGIGTKKQFIAVICKKVKENFNGLDATGYKFTLNQIFFSFNISFKILKQKITLILLKMKIILIQYMKIMYGQLNPKNQNWDLL